MAVTESRADRTEDRLHAVLADYFSTVDAGAPEDRNGLITRHPDLAVDLAAFFAGQDDAGRLADVFRDVAPVGGNQQSADGFVNGTLGDYRIVREVGRG